MNGVDFSINLKDNFSQTLKKVDQNFSTTFDKMKKKTELLSSKFSTMGTSLATLGITIFAKKVIDATANVEKMNVRLNSAFDRDFGGGFGENLLKDIIKVQESSEIGLNTFVDYAIKMKEVEARSGNLTDTLSRLSDISQGNEGAFSTLSDTLTKLSKGFAFTERDLKSFTLLGFDPLVEIAKESGESLDILHQKLKDGKIGYDNIQIAIKRATSEGGSFANLSTKIAAIFGERLNTQIGRLPLIFAKIGKPLTEKLEPLLTWFEGLNDKIMSGKIDLTNFTKVMANFTIAGLGAVGMLKAVNFVVSMSPIGRLVGSVVLLGSYLYEAIQWSEKFTEIWNNFDTGNIADGFLNIGKVIVTAVTKPIWALLEMLTSIMPGDFFKGINASIVKEMALLDAWVAPKVAIDATTNAVAVADVKQKTKTTTELISDYEDRKDAENQTNRVSSGGIQTFNLSINNLIGMNVGTMEGKDIDASKIAEILKVEILKQTAQIKGF